MHKIHCDIRMCQNEAVVKLTVLKPVSPDIEGQELNLCSEHFPYPKTKSQMKAIINNG